MSERDVEVLDKLMQSPFTQSYFTNEHEQSVLHQIQTRKEGGKLNVVRGKRRFTPAIIVGIIILILAVTIPSLKKHVDHRVASQNEWQVRHEFWKDGKRIFGVYPGGGDVPAGKRNNYKIIIDKPFNRDEDFYSFRATHQNTELKFGGLSKFTSLGPYNESLTVVQMNFALPLSGKWKLELCNTSMISNKSECIGDVVMDVPEHPWVESPIFESGNFQMRGIENRVGFIGPNDVISGQGNKYMWHFWGSSNDLKGEFEVIAVRQGSNEMKSIFKSELPVNSGINGAQASLPSSLTLPEPGMWRLMVYINNVLFDSIVVKAN
ncbi:DUF4871 domain-containing protein [Paenibacillus sp. KN14-4R]|uniref:DUF4871 domain-containing protein n=1 Tax=Paenibacillus sp. KN14-4R TaxID=3445773 RepID=UPI003F9F66EA